MYERFAEIETRLKEIEREKNKLQDERRRLYKDEIRKMFTWDVLSGLEWHIVYPNADSICIRSLFRGDLYERFCDLQRKSGGIGGYNLKVNGFNVEIGSQALALINLTIDEFYALTKILKIVTIRDSCSTDGLKKTIEYLRMLSELGRIQEVESRRL